MFRRSPARRRTLAALLTALFVLLGTGLEATAQEDKEKLEELKEERERLQEELAAKALDVDVATADADAVIEALEAINTLVDLQQARVADAEQAVRSAEAQVEAAERRRTEIEAEMEAVREQVSDLAVAAFTGEGGANGEDLTAFLLNDDPTEAARRRSLVEFQTGNLGDGLEALRSLGDEIEVVERQRRDAVGAAVLSRQEALEHRRELEAAEEAQTLLVIDAEARLEARLAEAQYLQDEDAALAADIRRQEEAIARRIREEAARKAAAAAARAAANRQPPADRSDMVNAEGFIVHQDVAAQVADMIRAARADGVILNGYGWRSPQRTAELRIINGCPDVHDSPPSRCRIPTARPGQSMHEVGKAIDFSSCWRGSPCFTWLSRNAARYGFYNLPSESWHWSVNGR